MNRCWTYFFIWISFFGFHLVFGQIRNRSPIIIIDPGHGGKDSGAVGVNGLKEKDVTLNIAMEILRLNKELLADTLEIYSTRYSDTLISLSHRTKLAQVLKGNIFVSLHCNQTSLAAVQGVEVYTSQFNKHGEFLGNILLSEFNQTLGHKSRGVKYGNFQVLRETDSCPSVLWEMVHFDRLIHLPTEAEWERAAQSDHSGTVYFWGDDASELSTKANTWEGEFPVTNTKVDGYGERAPVKSYPPNDFGLYDMAGNVWEWTDDWYNTDYYNEVADRNTILKNPKGADAPYNARDPYAKEKVMKGGSFLCNASYCASYRISARMATSMDSSLEHLGFRTVATAEMAKNREQ